MFHWSHLPDGGDSFNYDYSFIPPTVVVTGETTSDETQSRASRVDLSLVREMGPVKRVRISRAQKMACGSDLGVRLR